MIESNRILSESNVYNAVVKRYGYTKLSYIESVAGQYIDMDFYPNQDTRVVAHFRSDNSNLKSVQFFGARKEYKVDSYGEYLMGSGEYRSDYNTSAKAFSSTLSRLGDIVIDKNKNITTITESTGTHSITHNSATFHSPVSMYLFNVKQNAGFVSNGFKAQLISCDVYNNGVLIRNFIPAKRNDGVVGLYETIEKRFYINEGTGNFEAGPEIGHIPETEETPSSTKASNIEYACDLLGLEYVSSDISNRPISSGNLKTLLDRTEDSIPSNYIKLDFIMGTGTQYIDTEYNPGGDTGVKTRFQITEENSDSMSMFGAREGSLDALVYAMWCETADKIYRWDYNTLRQLGNIPYLNTWTIDWNKNQNIANGLLTETDYADYQVGRSLYIFALNQPSFKKNQIAKMKLYYFKMYDNDVLVRDYIPVFDIQTDKAGLYDKKNSKFYPSKTEDDFKCGIDGYTTLEFIEFDGNTYIDTEYVGSGNTRIIMDADLYDTNGSNVVVVFGGRLDQGKNSFTLFRMSETKFRFNYSEGQIEINMSTNGRFLFDWNKNVINIDGSKKYSFPLKTFETVNTMKIASTYNSVLQDGDYNDNRRFKGKLYKFKIYDNGILVRNFIPVKSPVGVVGLYDICQRKFYTNSASKGSFTAGTKL